VPAKNWCAAPCELPKNSAQKGVQGRMAQGQNDHERPGIGLTIHLGTDKPGTLLVMAIYCA
ncbi:MAG TPA: hypothetical protein PK417_06170, partial [Hyphomonas sp.]|nr:hypothetical protein [Hyphomonas sp.]